MLSPRSNNPVSNFIYSLGGALSIFAAVGLAMVSFIIVMRGNYRVTKTIRNLPQVKEQLENSIQQRSNLVPGFVAVASQWAAQESSGIGEIAEARKALRNARSFQEKFAADARLSKAIGVLVTASKAGNPQADSDGAFWRAKFEITRADQEIENAASRYNNILDSYNAEIQVFPGNVAAYVFGLQRDDSHLPTQARRE